MFNSGASGSSSHDKGKGITGMEPSPPNLPPPRLFLKPWDDSLTPEERQQSLDHTSKKEADKFLSISLVQQIQESPMKIQILERWEKDAFLNLEKAKQKLMEHIEVWLEVSEEGGCEVWYVDLGQGNLTWTTYNLILQFYKEEREIIICADPSNLINRQWSSWTEVFLDKLCPRKDWVQRRANFVLHLQANMQVADQNHMWFKFKLRHLGGRYTPLNYTVYTSQKFIKRNQDRQRIDSKVHTRWIPLNIWVESTFEGEFFCDPNSVMFGSDVEQCFSYTLYLDRFPDESLDSDGDPFDCPCGGVDLGDGRGLVCICLQGWDPYD